MKRALNATQRHSAVRMESNHLICINYRP
jgi:hypothetical protein